jgi:DNA-binding LacI/PurR family transcriptional regulator
VEMSLFSSHVHELNQCDVVRELRLRNADGAVILRATDQSGYISSLEDQQFPDFCLLNNDGKPSEKLLSIDEENLARTAVDYLISLGHRRIGALAASPSSRACQLRLEGYRQALENNGIPFDARLVLTADPSLQRGGFQFGYEGIERLMKTDSGPTAVFTTAEEIARGVLFKLNERGVKIPEQMSVLGFDDYPGTAYTWPALTTVRIPYIATGFEGARQVHRLMRGLPLLVTDDARDKIKGELIVRRTTGPENGHENK